MTLSASEARRTLFPLIEQLNQDRTVVEVESRHGNIVMMAADEYSALVETAHLFKSPANAQRLTEAYAGAVAGDIERHELDLGE